MAISESFLSELRDRISIEEVVSPYVNLKRRGRTMVGLCPFHNEKTPSFNVYTDNNSFYCFGCGAGGDIITFTRKIENYDYVEAVKSLAQRAGLNMPEDGYDDSLARSRQRMLAANKQAARFFHECLYDECGKEALSYLLGRGLTHKTIKHFGLGYAPNSWDSLIKYMRAKGFSLGELFEANLIKKRENNGRTSYYDNFRNRFMTPIIDVRGNVIAFGGRVLDDSKPKYVNTSDTLVYKKSKNVFALNFAKSNNDGRLILCEGYMDVIALHQAGITNAVAGCGTALTREQANLLSRYTQEVLLSYDSDEAGQEAVKKAIAIFKEIGMKLRVINLSGGKDPDEIIKKYGAERFRSLIEGAANDIEFKLAAEKKKYDIDTDDGKLNYLKAAVAVLAASNDRAARELYSLRLSEELNISSRTIEIQINEIVRKRKRSQNREQFKQAEKIISNAGKALGSAEQMRAAKAEERLLAVIMNNPDFYKSAVKGKITSDDFVTELNSRIFKALSQRLEEEKEIDPIYLNGEFTEDEMGRIIRIREHGRDLANTEEECADCIKVIIDEKNKKDKPDPGKMSDDEWLNALRNRNNKK